MDAAAAPLLLLLLLAVLLLLRLRRRRPTAASARARNHCPYPNPVVGNVVPFIRNFHRFLDWATDLLAAAPASTIEVRGALGLGNGIATANPGVVDHLLRANFPNYVKGARFAASFADLLGRGLFLVDGRLWNLQRKLASYSFSSRSLRRFSGRVLRAHIHRRLLPFLEAAAESGEPVDLQDVLKRFAFDNICNVAFGVESSTLLEEAGDRRRHEAFFKAFDDAVKISFARMFHPTTAVWKAMRLADVGSERRLREAIGVIDEYVMAIMESEQLRGNDEQHLLSRFTAAMEEDDDNELGAMFESTEAKRRFLRDIVVSFVLAGKDSTSSGLTWFFWLLAANPRCERLVYEEASRHGDDHGVDGDGYDELKGMRYLHAAITEAMRLYPPVPINSRVAAAGDVLPDGTTVRAGWFADYSAYAMGRMTRLWGDDCREFRPERWLDKGGELVAVDATRYPVFHAGPRACIGKEMAYVQMKAVVAAVVRRFVVETVQPASMEAPPPYEMTVTLRMKGGLPVRIKRREGHATSQKLTNWP
ncbi:cytochrome P450 CYP94D108-like [Phragmites australis]|uniref:cytochrome P450 CYP94D108-like n=1 Tax=Phragmites australis TaxID=29695 RepID=UPI002D789239|nr:cytochrome P450 CYP94D108-like [Phragmites australis]